VQSTERELEDLKKKMSCHNDVPAASVDELIDITKTLRNVRERLEASDQQAQWTQVSICVMSCFV